MIYCRNGVKVFCINFKLKNVSSQVINIKKPTSKELSEEEKQKQMMSFIEKYEKDIKDFGMLSDYGTR